MMSKPLLFVSAMLVAAPSFADTCSGEWSNDVERTKLDEKVTLVNSKSTVSSKDSPMSGSGSCTGYVYDLGGGRKVSSTTCLRTTAAGDTWLTQSTRDMGEKGQFKIVYATGKLAPLVGTTGWFAVGAQGENKMSGTWGGDCPGLK